jgi:hypothetical protein
MTPVHGEVQLLCPDGRSWRTVVKDDRMCGVRSSYSCSADRHDDSGGAHAVEPSFIQRQASHPCARLHKRTGKFDPLVDEGLSHRGQLRNRPSTVRDTARWCGERAIPLGGSAVTSCSSR